MGDPAGDLVGHRLHEVGDRDDRALALEQLRDPGGAGGLVGVKPVPALGAEGLLAQPLVARGRVQLSPDAVVLGQLLRSEEHTSELQSLMRISYAVLRLKKQIKNYI